MNILEKIVAHKRVEIAALRDIPSAPKCTRNFDALFANPPCIIAEIKAKSPSEGVIAAHFDPIEMAKAYVRGGANAISVLTDEAFFGGSFDVLKRVRSEVDLPLLCKEFVIDPRQVRMARSAGADLVLLIVKILDLPTLCALKAEIESHGMKALIEIQNVDELQTALAAGADLLLINNRNLTDFSVDMNTTRDLLAAIPPHVRVIAASGIQNPSETKDFPPRVDGFLIGTALMRSENPTAFLEACR